MRLYGSEDNHRWAGFEHRPGDIVISTRSKCGTTLAQMVCALLVFQDPDLPAPLAEISPWLDSSAEPLDAVRDRLASQRHRRIIKTHTPLDGLPLDPRVTYLVVGRHPLDVAVSLYHHGQNIDRARFAELSGQPPLTGPTGPLPDWFRTWVDPSSPVDEQLDTLPGLVHHITDARACSHEVDVVLVRYEELVEDAPAQMRAVAARLGISVSEDRWPSLVKAASFDAMRCRAPRFVPDRLGVLKDPEAFFRSGRPGDGQRVLGDDDLALYHRRISELASPEVIAWLHGDPPTGPATSTGRGAAAPRVSR